MNDVNPPMFPEPAEPLAAPVSRPSSISKLRTAVSWGRILIPIGLALYALYREAKAKQQPLLDYLLADEPQTPARQRLTRTTTEILDKLDQ